MITAASCVIGGIILFIFAFAIGLSRCGSLPHERREDTLFGLRLAASISIGFLVIGGLIGLGLYLFASLP